MIQRSIRYETMFLVWATLWLLFPQQCFSGNERLISCELALIKVLQSENDPFFAEYDKRLRALAEELNKLVRLSVNGKLCPFARVSVCRELGDCPENSINESNGGPLCCSIIYGDDTIHVPEVISENKIIRLNEGQEIEVFSEPSLGVPRFFLVTEHIMPPNAHPVRLKPDGKLMLNPISRRFDVLFAIVKGDGSKLFKKIFWVLAPIAKP